jgi:hypothetical protein
MVSAVSRARDSGLCLSVWFSVSYPHNVLFSVVLVRQLVALLHAGQAYDVAQRGVVRRSAQVVPALVRELLQREHGDHDPEVLAAVALHHHEVSSADVVAGAVHKALDDALELDLQSARNDTEMASIRA